MSRKNEGGNHRGSMSSKYNIQMIGPVLLGEGGRRQLVSGPITSEARSSPVVASEFDWCWKDRDWVGWGHLNFSLSAVNEENLC